MRLLFTCVPANGHFIRLLPVVEAAAAAGHEVTVACSAAFGAALAERGLRHLPAGEIAFPESGITDVARREEWLARVVLPDLTAAMYPDVLDAIAECRPDVVVHGFAEQAAGVAAAAVGLPHVTIAECSTHALIETYRNTCAATNLRPDGAPAPREPLLHLCFHPPTFHGPDAEFAPASIFVRHENEVAAGAERAEKLLAGLDPELPLVVVSLGTIVAEVYPEAVARLTDLLCDDRLRVVVLMGGPTDEVHEIAENRLIAVNGPQRALLNRAAVAVSSGGFNGVIEALAEGLPQVIGPIQLDAYYSADRCRQLGIAAVVDLARARAGTLRSMVHSVLGDPGYRRAAEVLAAENAALPSVSEAVTSIERMMAVR